MAQLHRKQASVFRSGCRAAGRKFFELANIVGNVCGGKSAHEISLIALKAVKRTDVIFDIEREINDKNASTRLATQQERSRPLVESLRSWLIGERSKLSKYNGVAKAIDYFTTLKHGGDRAAVMCITHSDRSMPHAA
jgi:hypothetical protein